MHSATPDRTDITMQHRFPAMGPGHHARPQLRSQINRNGERVMRSEEEACRESISMPILSAGSVWSISRITVTPEDIFQTVFLKYVLHTAPFDSPEHEKAWIIRVTINACKEFIEECIPFQDRSPGTAD